MATIPSLRTWVTGEIVTAAEMNANVRDPANWLVGGSVGQRPQFVATNTASQTYTTGVTATQTYNTVARDTDSGYSAGSYAVVTAGVWLVTSNVQWANNGTGVRTHNQNCLNQAYTYVSAATDPLGRSTLAQVGIAAVAASFSVQLSQTSGGNLGTAAGNTSFCAIWLGS